MDSTTIRVDRETHARLVRMSKLAGTSVGQTVRDAAEALSRQHFAQRVVCELEELRRDRAAWAAYLDEAKATQVTDGIG